MKKIALLFLVSISPNFCMDKQKSHFFLDLAFFNAADKGNIEKVKKYLAKGANPNFTSGRQSSTALHLATWDGNLALCQILLKGGANIDARSKDGTTPLHHAVQWGHEKICKLLLDAGAYANAINHDGVTPICRAFAIENFNFSDEDNKKLRAKNSTNLVTMLINAGADINVTILGEGLQEVSPLFLALIENNVELIKQCIDNGSNLNCIYYEESHLRNILTNSHDGIEMLAEHIIFAPTLSFAQSRIKTTLLCLNRICPQMPKDLRHFILNKLPELAHLMILRRINGATIPNKWINICVESLMEATITRMIAEMKQIAQENGLETYHIENTFLNDETFHAHMRENMRNRIARPKLLINNPQVPLKHYLE